MVVSGQRHALTALSPEEELPVSTEQENEGWSRRLREGKHHPSLPDIHTWFLGSLTRSPVTTLTELHTTNSAAYHHPKRGREVFDCIQTNCSL